MFVSSKDPSGDALRYKAKNFDILRSNLENTNLGTWFDWKQLYLFWKTWLYNQSISFCFEQNHVKRISDFLKINRKKD